MALSEYPAAVNADQSLTQPEKDAEIEWAEKHRTESWGLFLQEKISFGSAYAVMMGTSWKVRND
jgi:hypothetical protein